MSFRHVEELNAVRDEFLAVRDAATYALNSWSGVASEMSVGRSELAVAIERLEATYIVRLTAGYEAIAFDALRRGAGRKVDDKASGAELTDGLSSWLQDRIKATSRPSSDDRRKVGEIKDRAADVRRLLRYRNRLAHREPPRDEEFDFGSARSCLNHLLALIP